MITLGKLRHRLNDVLSGNVWPEVADRIDEEINYQYFELCSEISWARLRPDPVTCDFSAISSGGVQLPSDMMGIDLVWDDTDDIQFWPKDRDAAELDEWGYRYYLKPKSESDLYDGSDLVLSKGGSSFTSAALTAAGTDPNGEYVRFGDTYGIYKITSSTTPFTFTPTYHGPNLTQENFRIRPWENTWEIVIQDEDEDELYDRSVYVYYWRQPRPLYRDQDVTILPNDEILFMRVLRAIPQAKQKSPVSERMLDDAMKRAVRRNPTFGRIATPKSKHGLDIDFSESPFTSR